MSVNLEEQLKVGDALSLRCGPALKVTHIINRQPYGFWVKMGNTWFDYNNAGEIVGQGENPFDVMRIMKEQK